MEDFASGRTAKQPAPEDGEIGVSHGEMRKKTWAKQFSCVSYYDTSYHIKANPLYSVCSRNVLRRRRAQALAGDVRRDAMKLLGRWMRKARRKSPHIFHLNTGSCNGCDIELVTCLSPRYDVEQLGIHLASTPHHADILCITGPVTRNTLQAVKEVYAQVCEPKAVVALGSCTASCNVFAGSPVIEGPLDRWVPVDVYVPGCPPHPDAMIDGIMKAAAILAERGARKAAKGGAHR